ncbi:MAG: DUF2934 domain-containing protein [Bryobacteraceae bacterium]|jgi:hypothetical protein
MAKKQAIVKETAAAAAPATSARAAKPKTPRVKAAQHSKSVSTEPVSVQSSPDNAEEAIARMAYSYWESRGYQGGSALEDWVRAEHEYRHRAGATRL